MKRLFAVLSILAVLLSLCACANTPNPQSNPEETIPTEPEPIPETDPNAPLFDIQDEAVFNQKVDELYNEVKDLSSIEDELYTHEDVEELIKLINITNISNEYFVAFLDYDMIDFSRVFDNYALIQSDKVMNAKESHFADFTSDPQYYAVLLRLDSFVNKYHQTGEVTDDDIQEIDKAIVEFRNAIDNRSKTFIPLRMYMISIYQICYLYEKETGIPCERNVIIFDLIPTDLETYADICDNIYNS